MAVQQKITINLPSTFSDTERKQAGKLLIKLIKARTAKGLDINNQPFKGYSEAYKASKDFKIAGKTDRVNLELSSEMMDSLEILGTGHGFVTIGYESGTDVNERALWAKDFGNGPSRKFLGVSKADIKKVTDSIASDKLGNNVRGLLSSSNFNIFDFLETK